MIEGLSNSVIMPIASIIITFVLCYELISMLTERNNMHDIDTWMFFKYFVKNVDRRISGKQYVYHHNGGF